MIPDGDPSDSESFFDMSEYNSELKEAPLRDEEESGDKTSSDDEEVGSLIKAFIDFKAIIDGGNKAACVRVSKRKLTIYQLKRFEISASILQRSRFPKGNVLLRVTETCLVLLKFINDKWLNSKHHCQGVLGPAGMGKSYSLLFNYLLLKSRPKTKVIYINNPEALLVDHMYIVKELIYCFAPEISGALKQNKTFADSKVSDLNARTSEKLLKSIRKGSVVSNVDLLRLLWSLYLDSLESEELHMPRLRKVLQILMSYCKSVKSKFLLLWDQFNLLFRTGDHSLCKLNRWRNMIEDWTGCFSKVLWVASQNNEFVRSGSQYFPLGSYLEEEELNSALRQHICSIKDIIIRQYWIVNKKQVLDFLIRNTKGHPLEVNLLLRTAGATIEEKWNTYFNVRVEDLLDGFIKYFRSIIFDKEIFFALVPLVDIVGNNRDYLDREICRRAFVQKQIQPGTIDWNLMFYDDKKRTFHSLNPVTRQVLNEIIFNNQCALVNEACASAFKDRIYSDPGLRGKLFEYTMITDLMIRKSHYMFNMSCLRLMRTTRNYCQTAQGLSFQIVQNVNFRSVEFMKKKLTKYFQATADKTAAVKLKLIEQQKGGEDEDDKEKEKSSTLTEPVKVPCFEAILLTPSLTNFSLVDFFILVPYWKNENGEDVILLLMFQTTVNIKTHKYNKSVRSDVAAKKSLCPSFKNVMEKLKEIKIVEKVLEDGRIVDKEKGVGEIRTQYIWLTEHLDVDIKNIPCDLDSWFMIPSNFNPQPISSLSSMSLSHP